MSHQRFNVNNLMDVPKSAHCCCLLGHEVIVDKHQRYPALGEEDN